MSIAGGNRFRLWEWVIIVGLGCGTIATAEAFHVSEPWEIAVAYTVIVFIVVILALRPVWDRRAFWDSLMIVFGVHAVAVVVIEKAFPLLANGLRGIPLILLGIVEGLILASVLWKRAVRVRSDTARRGHR